MKKGILICVLISLFSSCYRMPGDDDYSVIPTINNRDVTREVDGNPLMPNMNI